MEAAGARSRVAENRSQESNARCSSLLLCGTPIQKNALRPSRNWWQVVHVGRAGHAAADDGEDLLVEVKLHTRGSAANFVVRGGRAPAVEVAVVHEVSEAQSPRPRRSFSSSSSPTSSLTH